MVGYFPTDRKKRCLVFPSENTGGDEMQNRVTVVSVNFKTPGLIRDCIVSLRRNYIGIPIILIDNGGCSASLATVRTIDRTFGSTTTIENSHNIGHGPALHQGIMHAKTPYVFTLDSDTATKSGGFVEAMLREFDKNPKLFALGWLRYTNANGVASPKQNLKRGMPYVHPYACMIDRKKYLKLKQPFIHSGAPATKLMQAAKKVGYALKSFPIEGYIWHKEAGTRGCFAGEWRVGTDARKAKWRKHRI